MTTGCLDKINVTALESNKINFWDHLESSELVLETFLWSSATNKTIHSALRALGWGWLLVKQKLFGEREMTVSPFSQQLNSKYFQIEEEEKKCILRRLKRIWQFGQEFCQESVWYQVAN